MKKKLGILLVLMVAFAFLGCAQHMSPEQIAKNMIEKYKSIRDLKAKGIVEVKKFNGKVTFYKLEYIYKKPDKTYVYYENRNEVVVRNGSIVWIYDMKNNTVSVLRVKDYPMSIENIYRGIVNSLLREYNIYLVGMGTVSNRSCYIVTLVPKNQSNIFLSPIKLWIDRKYWYPLKIEMKIKTPVPEEVLVEYTNISFNKGVNDSLFNFKIPPGARIKEVKPKSIHERSKFSVIFPKYTAGCSLKYKSVSHSKAVLSFVNENTKKFIIIHEELKKPKITEYKVWRVCGIDVKYQKVGQVILAVFNKNNIYITILTNIDKAELARVIESMFY